MSRREVVSRVVKLNASMSGRGVVVVTVRDRQRSKVEGVAVRKRHDGRKDRELRAGESPLVYAIKGPSGKVTEVEVDRMKKVALRPFGVEGEE